MSQKILVVGANSALARAVIPVLAVDNKVITAGRKDCDVYCDIAEALSLPKVDVVINFAAAFGGNNDEEIMAALQVNAQGALNVCVAAKAAGASHVVHVSSMSAVLDEQSPYYSAYAITKRQGDELAHFYCQLNKMSLAIVRPSQIYGDGNDFATHQPFLYEIINRAQAGQDISIYGKHDALRNYIHSDDIAEIINRIIAKRIDGVYPCLSPVDVTFGQIVGIAQKLFNKGGKIIFVEDKPDIPDNIFAKDSSIYKKLDYYPQISIEAGIERIKSYREGARP